MKKSKKLIVLSLAASIAISPMVVKAVKEITPEKAMPISLPAEDINTSDDINKIDQVELPDYIEYKGKITEINENDFGFSILVKDDEDDPYNGMLFHINEDVILVNDETKEMATKDKLELGMTVRGYYSKDTIMLMSLPPQLAPQAIIVNESEEPGLIHVSNFNDELVSSDGSLVISISEDTIIEDKDGNKLDKEGILNKDLIVFYTSVRESYPAQTTPEKVILIEREEDVFYTPEVNVLDKIIINEKEIDLESHLYKNKEDVVMVPLREIAEALDYEVTWNNEEQRAELTKGAQWTAVTIGEDNYNFAKMLIKLGTAPEIKDSKTYVPFSFLEEVLRVGVEIRGEGIISIQ